VSEIRAHFAGGSDIWTVSAAPQSASATVAVSVQFGVYGTIDYLVQFPGFQYSLLNSTVANCTSLGDSDLLRAINDGQQYFDELATLTTTTTAQFTLNLTLAESLNEFTASPRLVADCQDALLNLRSGWGCDNAPWGCTQSECSSCCEGEFDRRSSQCWGTYQRAISKRSWWQNLVKALGIQPDDADESYDRCANQVDSERWACLLSCDLAGSDPQCPQDT
jgi:hypothetical protein